MKKLLLILLFIPLVSFGQKSNNADALKLCVALQSNNFTTDAEAEDAVNKILSVIGASQKPILQACSNINNAVAAVYKGQRYILYDRDFMNSLTAGSNQYWSNMFILAHEVGHHINGHSLDIILYANDVIDPKSLEEKRKQELEADEFAGFVLAKLGATLSQTSKVLSNLPKISNENSSTHPSKYKRIASVNKGFNRGEVKKEIVYTEISKKRNLNKKNSNTKSSSNELIANYNNPRSGVITLYGRWERWKGHPNEFWHKELDDPFDKAKIKKTYAIKEVSSSKYGKSLSSYGGSNNILLNVEQSYYKEDKDWYAKPNMHYSIKLMNWLEMPEFITDDPEETVEALFSYVIDGEYAGSFITRLWGRQMTRYKRIQKESGNLSSEVELDQPESHPKDLYFNWYDSKKYQKELLDFITKLKSGKKLYIKFDRLFAWNGFTNSKKEAFDTSYKDDKYEISQYTYEFDLTGSSKALKF